MLDYEALSKAVEQAIITVAQNLCFSQEHVEFRYGHVNGPAGYGKCQNVGEHWYDYLACDRFFVEHRSRNGHKAKLQDQYDHTRPKVEIVGRKAQNTLLVIILVHQGSDSYVRKQERIYFHELLYVEVEFRQPDPLDRKQKYYYARSE